MMAMKENQPTCVRRKARRGERRWHSVLEDLPPFPGDLGAELGQSRDVAARPRESGDEPGPKRIAGAPP